MNSPLRLWGRSAVTSSLLLTLFACSEPAPGDDSPTGGTSAVGGGAGQTGGVSNGGSLLPSGGVSSGGSSNPGGGSANPNGGSGNPTGGFGNPSGGSGNPSGGSGNPSGGGGNPTGGSGGGGPLTGELTDVTQFTPVANCVITPMVQQASIPMVGIATFTTDLPGADRAIIQFGKTADYTLEAPVDFAAEGHRTLMLGMTANTEWHYRVVALAGNSACIGQDATFKTGTLPTGSPGNKTPMKGESSVPVTKGFRIVAGNNSWVTIWNELGEVVWAYNFGMVVSANMSWDGKYMYARDTGPFDAGNGGNIQRVAMEGGNKQQMNVTGGTHHDIVAIPTGFAYIGKEMGGQCDHIFTANPDGSGSKSLVDLQPFFAPFPASQSMEMCHVNAINYHHDATAPFYTLSDREKDVVIKVDAKGKLLGSIGKAPQGNAPNHVLAEGAGSTWRVQHGHHWYAPDKFIVYSNGTFSIGGGSSNSKAIHYTINGANASIDWQFPTGSAPTLSNAFRLPSGSFFVFAGMAGTLSEVDPEGKEIQTMNVGSGGYARYRATLYGPPMQY